MRRIVGAAAPMLATAALAWVTASMPALATDGGTSGKTAGLTVASLLAQFRALPGVSARFREEKRIALLADVLVSEGTIDFAPPARLARRITSPSPSMVLVNGSTLMFWDGRTTESIDLKSNPTVRLYVDSFVNLLAGDLPALQAAWQISLTNTKPGWQIVLIPSAAAIAKTIREMRLQGHGAAVDSMTLVEASGDETVTQFTNVDTSRRYSDADIKRIFRLPAP